MLDRQHAGLVDPPGPGDRIGRGEPDELAHVVREVHVVAAERTLEPGRHANHRRAVDVVAERGRGSQGEQRILLEPCRRHPADRRADDCRPARQDCDAGDGNQQRRRNPTDHVVPRIIKRLRPSAAILPQMSSIPRRR